jgi:hypothetical protein
MRAAGSADSMALLRNKWGCEMKKAAVQPPRPWIITIIYSIKPYGFSIIMKFKIDRIL